MTAASGVVEEALYLRLRADSRQSARGKAVPERLTLVSLYIFPGPRLLRSSFCSVYPFVFVFDRITKEGLTVEGKREVSFTIF